jgi:adenine-specific DNA-methyltransferase
MAKRKATPEQAASSTPTVAGAPKGAKERRFLEALRNVFVGATVSGQSGYINLMHIKASYFTKIVEPALMTDIEASVTEFPDFREELFDKLHAFFSRYFSKSGSICFAYTPNHMSVYEKVYTDEEDVVLFWKTHMLYFVKTDRLFRDLRVEVEGHSFFFDCTTLQHKKANEKRSLVFAFDKVEKDTVHLAVTYSERGRITKTDDILKALKKAHHPVTEAVLDKAMQVFARQSEVDYFINKDAASFLREQFDLWMYQYMFKDETHWTDTRVRQLQTLKDIAFRLITFIAQFEDELVRIWNKPKFVRGSHYLITLDRIAAQEGGIAVIDKLLKQPGMKEQVADWKALSIVDATFKPAGILEGKGKDRSLAQGSQSLPIDTTFFKSLELDILGLFPNLDEAIDGRLIKSENYQALNLLREKFKGRIKMVYIDPPYNTGGDGFQYQDAFRHASWITMLQDRLDLCHGLFEPKGVLFSSIDDKERRHLEFALDRTFDRGNRVEEIIWVQNTTKNQSPTYSTNHEYVEVYARDLPKAAADTRMFREPKPGYVEMTELVEKLNPAYPPIADIQARIADLFEQHRLDFRAELEEQGVDYDRSLDLWKGLYNYAHAEYRDQHGSLVTESNAKKLQARIWIWREDNPAMPPGKQAASTEDKDDPNFRYYKPNHPTTGKPCSHPKTGWRWPFAPIEGRATSFTELVDDDRIVWGDNEEKIPQAKKFLHEVDTQVSKSVVMDFTDGEKQLTDLVGRSRSFGNPKPTTLISRFILQTADENEWVLDFFAGSGTTGHSAVEAFHTDRARRRFILVESADYFDDTLVPRIKRVFAASRWKGGKPVTMGGPGLFCKICTLEQYEEAVGNAVYAGEEDLFRNTKSDPYSQYVFLRDEKMARALDLDYKKDTVGISLDRLYPDIDLAETLSCVTGKWIKRVTADEVEFADGSKQSLSKPDWRILKPLIFWGPSA